MRLAIRQYNTRRKFGSRILKDVTEGYSITTTALVATSVSVCLLVFWIMRISTAWVRVAADAYARQLVSATELLEPLRECK